MAFDANGIMSYRGVVFYAVRGVRIENNSFFDSAPKPVGKTDHYSFVFARGSERENVGKLGHPKSNEVGEGLMVYGRIRRRASGFLAAVACIGLQGWDPVGRRNVPQVD